MAAARAAEDSKSLIEVTEAAKEMRDKVNALVLLDTIRYVYRSGRIPRIAAMAGSMINVRPLLSVYKGVNFIGIGQKPKKRD